MWSYLDNQDVGLEAATIQRVRNSSLVKWPCAENLTGLSIVPKLWTRQLHEMLEVRMPKGCGEAAYGSYDA